MTTGTTTGMTTADWWTERAGLDGTVAIITGGAADVLDLMKMRG